MTSSFFLSFFLSFFSFTPAISLFFFLILFPPMIFTQAIQEGSDEAACRSDIGCEVEADQSVDVAVGKDEERGWGRERWPPLRLEIKTGL